jgi:soluble lytic murein transglycosylase-like protein
VATKAPGWLRWLRRTLLVHEAGRISRQAGVPPSLTRAVIWRESRGVPVATPEADGTVVYGAMQVKPGTAAQMGWRGGDPKALMGATGVYYGVRYLAWQLERYKGDTRSALMAYNGGTANPQNARQVAYADAVLEAQREGLI